MGLWSLGSTWLLAKLIWFIMTLPWDHEGDWGHFRQILLHPARVHGEFRFHYSNHPLQLRANGKKKHGQLCVDFPQISSRRNFRGDGLPTTRTLRVPELKVLTSNRKTNSDHQNDPFLLMIFPLKTPNLNLQGIFRCPPRRTPEAVLGFYQVSGGVSPIRYGQQNGSAGVRSFRKNGAQRGRHELKRLTSLNLAGWGCCASSMCNICISCLQIIHQVLHKSWMKRKPLVRPWGHGNCGGLISAWWMVTHKSLWILLWSMGPNMAQILCEKRMVHTCSYFLWHVGIWLLRKPHFYVKHPSGRAISFCPRWSHMDDFEFRKIDQTLIDWLVYILNKLQTMIPSPSKNTHPVIALLKLGKKWK